MRLLGKNSRARTIAPRVITALVFAAMLAVAFRALDGVEKTGDGEQTRLLLSALRKAAVTCYAVEGRYPDSLEYLAQEYGVVIDGTRYAVTYDAFASNVMPAIRVMRKGTELP